MARTIAKDHEAKRISILKTAARVCAQQGCARASMARIAQDCQISKATIYHYYASKDALLFDILDSYLRALRDRLADLPLDALDPETRLHRYIAAVLRAYEGMDHEHKIQTEALPLLDPAKQQILKAYQRDMVRQLSDLLTQAAPEAFAGDPARLRSTTMSVFGILNWFYIWNRSATQTDRDGYAALVADLVLNGARGR